MKKNIIKLSFFIGLIAFMFQSCESTQLEILDNPNSITPDQADENFVLNGIQVSFGVMATQTDLTLGRAMRYDHQFGAYNADATFGINAQRINDDWRSVYIGMFQNIRIIETIAQTKNIPFHLGVSHVLEAYTLLNAVDKWGDIPYTEANLADDNGSSSFNPSADDDEFLYDRALEILDQALSELNQVSESTPPINDIYYNGNVTNWVKLANSIKLSAYLNLRLVRDVTSNVNTIISSTDNYISSNAEDFQFQYSTQNAAPDSRHTRFINNYISAPRGYLGNWLFDEMLNNSNGGTTADPRMRYYFYRQTATDPNVTDAPCTGNPNYDFCYVGNFYRGRDHGDDLGIPNDASRRTTFGLYPAGGKFDDDSFTSVNQNEGAQGAGITPILTHSFIQFMLAELALTEGVAGNSSVYLAEGVKASFEKVRDFRSDLVAQPFAITTANINSYLNNILTNFNAADTSGKMNLIADEFYIAAFGNSMHAYNLFKRTGFPQLQSSVTPAGPFPRLLSYPNSEVNGNSNISQRQVTEQVFWDNNPAGFIE